MQSLLSFLALSFNFRACVIPPRLRHHQYYLLLALFYHLCLSGGLPTCVHSIIRQTNGHWHLDLMHGMSDNSREKPCLAWEVLGWMWHRHLVSHVFSCTRETKQKLADRSCVCNRVGLTQKSTSTKDDNAILAFVSRFIVRFLTPTRD